MYPRSAAGGDASAASASTSDRRETRVRSSTEPTTRYEDGPLDALAIALFNRNCSPPWKRARVAARRSAEEKNALPRAGFDRLVALADGIGSSGRSPAAQRAVVLETLLGLIAPVRVLFKILIKPSAWVDATRGSRSGVRVARGSLRDRPRETDGELAAVRLRKCRYLEQCGCVGSSSTSASVRPRRFPRSLRRGRASRAQPRRRLVRHDLRRAAPVRRPGVRGPCYASCGAGAGRAAVPENRRRERREGVAKERRARATSPNNYFRS